MSDDLQVSASVSRAELDPPLTDLNINDGEKFVMAKNFEPGAVTWRKEVAMSAFVHGRTVINEVMDAVEANIGVYVRGESHGQLKANLREVIRPFTEQYRYTLKITVEGQDYEWRCERADYEVGFATEYLNSLYVPVAFAVHRNPVAIEGPI